jgi:exodeoxyribonuclease VII small subunit
MTKTERSEALQEMTLEEAFQALDEMIVALESREITLEESFQKYEQAMELVKACNGKIDQVEKKVLILNENGEANEF